MTANQKATTNRNPAARPQQASALSVIGLLLMALFYGVTFCVSLANNKAKDDRRVEMDRAIDRGLGSVMQDWEARRQESARNALLEAFKARQNPSSSQPAGTEME